MAASPLATARAGLFQIAYWLWTAGLALAALPIAPFLGAPGMRAVARLWMRGVQALLRVLIGLEYEVRGVPPSSAAPALIASKHQSAWETLTFHLLVPDIVIGLKHELTRIPVLGWYLMKAGNIRIDRGGAAKALRSLTLGAREAAARGCSFLIFPEGTRQAPGAPPAYRPGVAALYAGLDLPVVPVALNSGLFWPRPWSGKRPGRIVIAFLEPIPPGLDRKRFMTLLETRIEQATAALVAEARDGPAGRRPAGQPERARLYRETAPR